MSQHRRFTIETDVPVYVCDPHSPWQRRSNENTNGPLRQYFPKSTDLRVYTRRPASQRSTRSSTVDRGKPSIGTPRGNAWICS